MPSPARAPRQALALAFAFAATVACSERQQPGQPTPPQTARSADPGDHDALGPLPESVGGWRVSRGANAGYVPDQACKECHQQLFDSYQAMGMARSFYRPDPAKAVESFGTPFVQTATGRSYEMVQRDGKYLLRRYLLDREGKRYAEYEAEVAWVIGSGNHVRSYLSQNRYGELKELPLSWYPGHGWGMSPGYDHPGHKRFERVITRGCMFCHNAYPEIPVGADRADRAFRFPAELPHGIGCQRCHGPGARHIEQAAREEPRDEDVRARIYNPGRASLTEREQLCASCHLQPESMVGELLTTRFDVPEFSLRPGQPLEQHRVYLDHGAAAERSERFQVNHHGYRLRQSRCYTVSGKLTCVTCHDPHRKVAAAERPAFYRAKCAGCHRPTDCRGPGMSDSNKAAASDCVACHMPTRRPIDVVLAKVTDHRIARRRPGGGAEAAPPTESMPDPRGHTAHPLFPGSNDPQLRLFELLAFLPSEPAKTRRQLRDEFLSSRPHGIDAYLRVGRALLLDDDPSLALGVLHEAVEKFPNDAATHWALGDALLAAAQIDPAMAALQKARRMAPDHPGILRSHAEAHSKRGAWPLAVADYARSLELREDDRLTLQGYAEALIKTGKSEQARHTLLRVFAMNPSDEYSAIMAARLAGLDGQYSEQMRILRQASTHLPEITLHWIGELLTSPDARSRDPATALRLAEGLQTSGTHRKSARLAIAFAALFTEAEGDHASRLRAARDAGADPACCTGLEILGSVRSGRPPAPLLLQRYRQELGQPEPDALRGPISRAIRDADRGR
ncbi:MAG: tetratricopeptide repeat protein [Planctomycetes bacterium]|nr:tetratricopeptide repeat protein [Planctomycetota bacterium]